MRLPGILVEATTARNTMPPGNNTPAELIRFLSEHFNKTLAELLPVFSQLAT